MSVSIFDSFLTTTDMIAVFDDAAIVQACSASRKRWRRRRPMKA
jgi:hypothetical protein